jgi:hypothetical protein
MEGALSSRLGALSWQSFLQPLDPGCPVPAYSERLRAGCSWVVQGRRRGRLRAAEADENGSGVGLVNNVLVLIKREEVLERGSSLEQGVTYSYRDFGGHQNQTSS